MQKIPILSVFVAYFLWTGFLFCPLRPVAATGDNNLSGRILLDVERHGEAWYVWPQNRKRYYLGRPADAFRVMRELGLGISEWDFQRLAQAGQPVAGDLSLAQRLAGQIILQVEKKGEAWNINPLDLKKYFLGRPMDAFRVMRELGLGISRENLAKVHKPGWEESLDKYSHYERKKISTANGEFTIDLIAVDTRDPDLRVITAAASALPCQANCPAVSLGELALAHDAFAAINGTYFDTSAAKKNYSFFPVYDYPAKTLVNENQLRYWTTGPIMAWDENNDFYYFKDSREFPFFGWRPEADGQAISAFAGRQGKKLTALIGNKPRLIEDKLNLLIDWDIDEKQKTAKSIRNGLAVKGQDIYLVAAQAATVPDLALIMQALGAEYALNLDGGYSTALWYDGEYLVGPGRDIVNGIFFTKK